jgi:hypothetical protein
MDKDRLEKLEKDYPGITSTIRYFDEAELPACTHCGSNDTANVQIGIVGRTMAIAGMTRKFFLIPNGPRPGKYFCRTCQQYFDEANGQQGSSPDEKAADGSSSQFQSKREPTGLSIGKPPGMPFKEFVEVCVQRFKDAGLITEKGNEEE